MFTVIYCKKIICINILNLIRIKKKKFVFFIALQGQLSCHIYLLKYEEQYVGTL